jgi:hypothetical protein
MASQEGLGNSGKSKGIGSLVEPEFSSQHKCSTDRKYSNLRRDRLEEIRI